MGSYKTSKTFKRKLLAAAVMSCFASHTAFANPTGGTVASGSASIVTSGSTMTVTNTPNAIINWASFGIDAGETVRFVQQSSASAVLNRVTGNDPSRILGALQSNGKVFLINPNGIMFGVNARVDVNGLVASTLNMTDADFLSGRMRFNADRATPGGVSNAGAIKTPTGGFVYLLAPNVENSGIISTPSGEAILAAGNSVEIVDSTNPNQRVLVSAKSQDVNLSQLMTQSNGNIFSVLNSGKVSANTAVVGENGKVYLKSAGNIQTTSTSIVEAKGDVYLAGGHIQAFADGEGHYAGTFDVSGKNGGFVETSGHTLDIAGINVQMGATAPDGYGGLWLLDPVDFVIGGPEATAINTALGAGDVTISTSIDLDPVIGAGTPGLGDITVNAAIASGNANLLTLDADHDIIVNTGISVVKLGMIAGNDISINAGVTATDSLGMTAGHDISINTPGFVSATNNLNMFAANNIDVTGTVGADFLNIMAGNSFLLSSANISGLDISIIADNISITNSPIHAQHYGGISTDVSIGLFASSSISIAGGSYISAYTQTGNANTTLFAPSISISGGSNVIANSSGGGIAHVEIFGYSSLDISGASSVSSLGSAGFYSGMLLVSQNMHISGSTVTADYVGLNFDPSYIQAYASEFFDFNSKSTVKIDGGSSITATHLGFAGNDVLIDGSSLTSNGEMHGIVMNDLKIQNSGILNASNDMLLEVGGHLSLDNNSHVSAGNTLSFNFPLLASDGWLVDGVPNAFSGSSGSSITVNSAAPIDGANFFVTYGGLGIVEGTLGGINDDLLNSSDISTIIDDALLADAPTGDDFFGTGKNGEGDEDQKDKEDKPQQCS